MAAKKKRIQSTTRSGVVRVRPEREPPGSARATRLRRSDEEKVQLVRQVLGSGNQSAEIKRLGIYPNQFYDWKKRYAPQLGMAAGNGVGRGRGKILQAAGSVAEEAKAFIRGKGALIERLRAQRSELDDLIGQLES